MERFILHTTQLNNLNDRNHLPTLDNDASATDSPPMSQTTINTYYQSHTHFIGKARHSEERHACTFDAIIGGLTQFVIGLYTRPNGILWGPRRYLVDWKSIIPLWLACAYLVYCCMGKQWDHNRRKRLAAADMHGMRMNEGSDESYLAMFSVEWVVETERWTDAKSSKSLFLSWSRVQRCVRVDHATLSFLRNTITSWHKFLYTHKKKRWSFNCYLSPLFTLQMQVPSSFVRRLILSALQERRILALKRPPHASCRLAPR